MRNGGFHSNLHLSASLNLFLNFHYPGMAFSSDRFSENAVLIQMYTALTTYLLLKYQKFLSRLGLSVQQLFQLIQVNLFGTASLEELLNPRQRNIENTYDYSLLSLVA